MWESFATPAMTAATAIRRAGTEGRAAPGQRQANNPPTPIDTATRTPIASGRGDADLGRYGRLGMRVADPATSAEGPPRMSKLRVFRQLLASQWLDHEQP